MEEYSVIERPIQSTGHDKDAWRLDVNAKQQEGGCRNRGGLDEEERLFDINRSKNL
jgi:hypothetical protein